MNKDIRLEMMKKLTIYLTFTFVLLMTFGTPEVMAQKCDEPKCDNPFGCPQPPDDPPEPIDIPVIHGYDPNIIIGPEGYDSVRWVSATETLPYKILFENDPDFATGPAQTVLIYQVLDSLVDPASFRLGSFGFGSYVFEVSENLATYSTRLDVRDSLGIFVDVLAGVDFEERQAFWIFKSIDPETGRAPDDAFTGFLQLSDTTSFYNDTIPKAGEGFVNYSIQASSQAQTGDTIQAQAGIVFDLNAPVITNIWTNIVDAKAPQSVVSIETGPNDEDIVTLKFEGEDDLNGVGLKNYDLYLSENEELPYLYKENIEPGLYQFEGSSDQYCFFAVSRDYVLNEEELNREEQQCITLKENQKVDARTILEGPYGGNGTMLTVLNEQNALPIFQPYNRPPWNYKGYEQVENMPDSIVDWVLVSLRTSKEQDSVVARVAALLTKNGQIVGTDGELPSLKVPTTNDSFYVAVYHRNHVGLMSGNLVSDSLQLSVDFTKNVNEIYGGKNGIKDLGDGFYGMFSGDVDANGQVQNIDINLVFPTVGLSGYRQEDADMNNEVQNTDVQNSVQPNTGKGASFEQEKND